MNQIRESERLRARYTRFINANARDLAIRDEARALLRCWLERSSSQSAPVIAAAPIDWSEHQLAFHAPIGLLEGAWLDRIATPANGDHPTIAKLFAVQRMLWGSDATHSPMAAYRAALVRAGIDLPASTSAAFAHSEHIGLPALAFANVQLALGLLGAEWLPERLGFTLGYLESEATWRLPCLSVAERETILSSTAKFAGRALAAIEQGPSDRIDAGRSLFAWLAARYQVALVISSQGTGSAREVADIVADLFVRKAPHARGYHAGVTLEGRPLDQWFGEPFDAPAFLKAFARSPWVANEGRGCPFDRLVGFEGPMFGIFSSDELRAIRTWLDDGAAMPAAKEASADSVWFDDLAAPSTSDSPSPTTHRTETRKMFHALLGGEIEPQILEQAVRRLERVFRRAERYRTRGERLRHRFFEYDAHGLSDWVQAIHREEIDRYQPWDGKPTLTREEYAWGIRQFAPAVLVDGAWLEGLDRSVKQADPVIRRLQQIYWDELGAGEPRQHHPAIYRRLLDSLGIDLAPVDSEAFAEDRSLLDAAFDLPVHLLSIARFSDRYLPEILGLNLAIELSGLGAQYLRLVDELRHWRIDPTIVSLHQSIDSLAGGHAALATEAVRLFLDQIAETAGADAVPIYWRRIWRGYRSLDTASSRFRLSLIGAFAWRFLPARIVKYFAAKQASIVVDS